MTRDHVPLSLQRRVRERAANRCEYCRIAQIGQEATFHVDHVWPRREGGATVLSNLALACVSCSLRKGAKTIAPDPMTGDLVSIFNPRADSWPEHFDVAGDFMLVGRTAIGRATAAALRLNRLPAVEIRRQEALRNRYP